MNSQNRWIPDILHGQLNPNYMNSTYAGITQILYLLPYCLVLYVTIPVLHGLWIAQSWLCVCMCILHFLSINVNECIRAKSSSKSVTGFSLCAPSLIESITKLVSSWWRKFPLLASWNQILCKNMVLLWICLGRENRSFLKGTFWGLFENWFTI